VISLFDAGFIHILFDDRARVPRDSKGKPVIEQVQARIDFLVQTISERKDKIILPTPALTEFMLLAADRYRDYLTIIKRKAVFEIAGFDDPEAIELVEHWAKFGDGKKLKARTAETWAKLKYDRQIAAIAVTRRVEIIYSTDSDLEKYAKQLNIKYCGLADLPAPPTQQTSLPFEETKNETEKPISPPAPVPRGAPGSTEGEPGTKTREEIQANGEESADEPKPSKT
jgi:predicted nucleic acid-binding protein